MPAKNRAAILHRLADLIDRIGAVLGEIESKDVGKPRGQALAFDVPHAAQTFRYNADDEVRNCLASIYPSAAGTFFECMRREGERAFLLRFAAAGAANRYRAINGSDAADIVPPDIALH
jgi:hypothetical protein